MPLFQNVDVQVICPVVNFFALTSQDYFDAQRYVPFAQI